MCEDVKQQVFKCCQQAMQDVKDGKVTHSAMSIMAHGFSRLIENNEVAEEHKPILKEYISTLTKKIFQEAFVSLLEYSLSNGLYLS